MTLLQTREYSVSIGRLQVVRAATLTVGTGEFCGLVGPNGAGKTTFMRGLMGALKVKGTATFGDVDLTILPPHRRAALGIGYMPSDRRLVPELSVTENILLPAWTTSIPDASKRLDWIHSVIPEIKAFAGRRKPQLSGGQQKLVALGRAIMAGRHLLLLDEPFEGLAPALVQRIGEILLAQKSKNVSALISDSNEAHLAGLLDKAYRIERGHVENSELRQEKEGSAPAASGRSV